jgi:hypothetical protein
MARAKSSARITWLGKSIRNGLDSVLRAKIPVLNGLVAFWVYGVKTVYPELGLKDLLTSKVLAIYNAFVEDGCSAASDAFAPLSRDEIFLPGWKKNEYIQEFLKRDSTRQRSDLWAFATGWRWRRHLV